MVVKGVFTILVHTCQCQLHDNVQEMYWSNQQETDDSPLTLTGVHVVGYMVSGMTSCPVQLGEASGERERAKGQP